MQVFANKCQWVKYNLYFLKNVFHCRLQQLICTGESGERAKKSKKMTKLSVIKAAISHIYTLQVALFDLVIDIYRSMQCIK